MKGKKGKFRYGKMLGITTLVLILGFSIFGVCREISLESAQRNLMAMLEAEQGNYNEDRAVLASTNKKEAQEMAEVFGGTLRITDNERFAVINLPDGVTLMEIAEKEEYRKYHDEIVLDYNNFSIAEVDTDVVDDTEIRSSYQVNDPMYHQQTYIDYLNIGDTWNRTRGKNSDGEKVTVAVIDTGIDTDHPEFIDADGNSIISTNSYDATNDKVVEQDDISVIEDTDGHGTAVAGVIAAQMNEVGIAGITPGVELLVIKCELDEARHFKSSADIVFAIYYAIEQDVDVINMSLGGDGNKDMLSAVQLAKDSDIICVAGAGNDSSDKPFYPAAYDDVIGVGALAEESWEIADYSNYGVNADIMAPGNALTTDLGGGYSYRNGTSIATPMVSASVAMYVAQNKYVNYEDLKADLLAAGKDLGDAGEDYYYGFGAIDVAAFVCDEKGLITYDYCTEEIEATNQVFVRQHTIQTVPEPERENVVFDDWYYDKAYTRVFEYENWYSTEFVEDVTLYAKWVNEDDEDASVYTYKTLSDGTIEITGYKGKRRYLTIPEEIDGKMVSAIGKNAFAGNSRLKEVVFPTGLVYIKESAFSGVTNMRNITFTGEKLQEIQKKAFFNCTALRNLEIPDSVEIIGDSAFENCTSVSTISISENSNLSSMGVFAFSKTGIDSFYIPENVVSGGFSGSVLAFCSNMRKIEVNSNNSAFVVENNTLYNEDKTAIVYYPSALTDTYQVVDGVHTICGYAFEGAKITAMNLNSVEMIGQCAFAGTKKLSKIILPNSIVELGEGAFCGSSIAHVMLSENLLKISKEAFSGTKITEIHIPEKVEIIELMAFANCSYLKLLTFAENSVLREIKGSSVGGAFFNCPNLENFNLPNSIENIGGKAFSECRALTKLMIPENVASIGESAFSHCSSLQTIAFSEGCKIQNISEYCFSNCTSLNKVYFSDNIMKLGKGSFKNNYLLHELNFGENSELIIIDDYCFYSCSNLRTMQIPESVTTIGEFAYAFSGLKKVEISKNITAVKNAAFGACYALEEVNVTKNNTVYAALDNVLFNKEISIVYCVPASRTGSYSLPKTVTTVAPYSFYYDILLTRVVLPEGLGDIQHNAFYNCSRMVTVDIPASVGNIGRNAFENCSELNSVTFASGSNVERLGIYTFVNCGLSEITIPASVQEMAQYVFFGCNRLKKITFEEGSQLSYVAAYLFKGTSIQNVVFEEGSALKNLQAHAFDGAMHLECVDFGDAKIINVDNYAFYGCSKLKEIDLPDTVSYIGRYAFYGCSLLERMHIPEATEFIGQYAFCDTNQLKVFFRAEELPIYVENDWDNGIAGYFLGAVDYIVKGEWEYAICSNGTIALSLYKGTSAELEIDTLDGYQVSKIGAACFRNNDTLISISLSENIVEVGNYAFYDCDALEMVELPVAVKRIGNYAFADSIAVVSLAKKSSLETIGNFAFAGNLTKTLDLPNSVTSIGEGAFYESSLSTVIIDENSMLQTIGTQAFVGTSLEEVYLPNTLQIVGVEAFKNVSSLVSVSIASGDTLLKLSNSAFEGCGVEEFELPARVYYIGEYALGSCRNLQNIYVVPENVYYSSLEGVLCDINGTTLIQYPCGRSGAYEVPKTINVLNYASFKDAKQLTEVTFQKGSMVRTIGWKTFSGCEKLVKITIPDSVVSFDFYAFENCTSLKEVILGENNQLTGVYEGAFYGCVSLENIMLPDCVNEIGEYAFYNCISLRTFPLTENSLIKGIYDYAFFGCSGIGEIPTLPELAEIGSYAFAYTNISEYTISEGVKIIASDAFVGCENLNILNCSELNTEYVSIQGVIYEKDAIDEADYEAIVVWPYGRVLIIGEGKEEITSQDTKIVYQIPKVQLAVADTVVSIGDYAFENCWDLSSIDLSNIVEIGDYAFKNCVGLKSVKFTDNLSYLGKGAFSACKRLENIIIPENVIEIGEAAFWGCSKVENIYYNAIAAEDVQYIYGANMFLGSSIFGGVGKDVNETNLVIGRNVIKIPAGLFFSDNNITNVEFEEGAVCRSIGACAFYKSAIKCIRLPQGLQSIGNMAFSGCSKMKKIVVPESVVNIDVSAFFGCNALKTAGPIGGGYDYEFGWKESIPQHAFDGYQEYDTIVIPCEMTEINPYITTNFSEIYTITIEQKEYVAYSNHVHEWSDFEEISEYIKCQQNGLKTYKCDRCGILDYEFLVAHSYVVEMIEATCKDEGYAIYTCSECQDNYSEVLDKLEHEYGGWQNVSNEISQRKCKNCDAYITGNFTTVASGKCGNNVGWVLKGSGELWIYGFGEIENQSSYSAVPWYNYRNKIISISIDENITSIGNYAFYGCTKLANISIPIGVTQIGAYVFYGCTNMADIDIPDTVTKIGAYTFYDCRGLTEVILPNNIECISNNLFRLCTKITNIFVPANVTSIEASAFDNCTSLLEIAIPDSTMIIADYAFRNCDSLKIIRVPDNVSTIGNSAFYDCDALEIIEIGKGLVEIGNTYVFGSCDNLESILVCDNNKAYCSVEGVLFDKKRTKILAVPAGMEEDHYLIPDTVTSIGAYAFYGCSKLLNVSMTSNIENIETYAFGNCENLNNIVLPESIKTIGTAVFAGCKRLENITIPTSITNISSNAFNGCTSLNNIVLPESINYIGTYAFGGCTSLNSIKLPEGIGYIGEGLFYGCTSLNSIEMPEKISSIGINAFSGCKNLSSIVLPESVKTIGNSAFYGCTNLSDIIIPQRVTSIGNSTFYKCIALNNIVLPENIKTIGNFAFYGCTNLRYIYFEGDAVNIGSNAFYKVMAYMYYSKNNQTWTEDIRQNYGGNLTWLSICELHEFSEWRTTIEAGCEWVGESRRDCENCEYFETKEIEATGHAYEEIVTAPTCEEGGYTTHTCSVCGDGYTDSEVEAMGHAYEEEITEPTCEEAGYTTHRCGNCGDSYVDSEVEALGHKLGEWQTVKEAGCEEAGSARRDCER